MDIDTRIEILKKSINADAQTLAILKEAKRVGLSYFDVMHLIDPDIYIGNNTIENLNQGE